MKNTFVIFAVVTSCITSCDQPKIRQGHSAMMMAEPQLDKEIRQVMEKEENLEVRRSQIPPIYATFAKRTDLQRARRLASLCYLKTLDTPFMPLDIAEIALAETGSHGLSATVVSPMGAMGVWQIMPSRARSHGYSSQDMKNDEKCADAAVRELLTKMKMARGNIKRAKKLYCGIGPQADAYEAKRMRFRREILREMMKFHSMWAENRSDTLLRSSQLHLGRLRHVGLQLQSADFLPNLLFCLPSIKAGLMEKS